jgi:hypothetical protein
MTEQGPPFEEKKWALDVQNEERKWLHGLTLLWQNLAIDWRNWIPESDFQ